MLQHFKVDNLNTIYDGLYHGRRISFLAQFKMYFGSKSFHQTHNKYSQIKIYGTWLSKS